MATDIDRLAIEAEADRLSSVYLRLIMLARPQRIDLLQAGRDRLAKGIVSAVDWALVWEALVDL